MKYNNDGSQKALCAGLGCPDAGSEQDGAAADSANSQVMALQNVRRIINV